jgi:hypothetical protein
MEGLHYIAMSSNEMSPRVRAALWWAAALLTIAAGFADLARGGETVAPILLAIGYLVLVPTAILKA